MHDDLKISLVIPCYNEEEGIRVVLEDIPDIIDEVIVVDNNCTDNTAEIALRMGAIVVPEQRQGYGASLKKGFSKASGDIIVTLDADGQHPIESIQYLVEVLVSERLDFISVSRIPDQRRSLGSWLRNLGNIVLNVIIYFLFGIRLCDSQSGMWVFRKSILNSLKLTSDNWQLSEEIKIEAFKNKDIKSKEIALICHIKRIGISKLSVYGAGMENALFLFKKKFDIHMNSPN